MNFFQKIFAKKEIIRARRYDMACSEIDRWLASDLKAVMIIEHITNYVNDKGALRPDKLRMRLEAIEKEQDELWVLRELNNERQRNQQVGDIPKCDLPPPKPLHNPHK